MSPVAYHIVLSFGVIAAVSAAVGASVTDFRASIFLQRVFVV